ncbi:MAG: hypothetical protein PF689_00265 [Deltaproteobacteria bacterium]|jgi:hypothetical protein|nr:hypothetical protein [Deltaproteobacteria bacterium]
MRNYSLFIFIFIFGLVSCSGNNMGSSYPTLTVQSDLPITKVVLYQNGVGYIEREGKIEGSVINLRIRHDQVKDILKTLTVIDRTGGQAVSISLPVEKSRLAKLGELPPQVRNSGGLLAISRSFRGARCRVETSSDSQTGRIVGVENLGTSEKPKYKLTILKSGGTLVSIKFSKIRAMKVIDKTLTLGLEKSLNVSLNKGTWKPINLSIRLNKGGTHKVSVSYVVEMPVWKPAYRMVMDKDSEKILLQGWSVVDNLSGDNWDKVVLHLTAGTPLAFKYDLYTPHTVIRPDLTPSTRRFAEAPPTSVASTYTKKDMAEKPALAPRRYKRKNSRRPKSSASGKKMELKESRRLRLGALSGAGGRSSYRRSRQTFTLDNMKRSYRNLVSGASIGSLFRYEIEEPVTVPDRSSALVNLINKEVEGDDILYFVSSRNSQNPYRAIKFKNTSGFVLERGPVAIYKKGQFVGETLGAVVQKNSVAFLPYAKEGKAIINLSTSYENENARLISIWNGVIRVEEKRITKYEYTVHNRTERKFSLWLRRRRRTNWKVVSKKKNIIYEKGVYYIPFKLNTGKNKFVLKEETPVRRTYSLTSHRTPHLLKLFLKHPDLPAKLKKNLTQLMDLWSEIGEIKKEMDNINDSKQVMRQEQYDARRNLKVLGKKGNRDLRRKLSKSISKLIDKISDLNEKWVKLNMKKGKMMRRISALFKMIQFKQKK